MKNKRNSNKQSIDRTLLLDRIHKNEELFLKSSSSFKPMTPAEISINLRNYCDLNFSDILNDAQQEDYFYWLYVASVEGTAEQQKKSRVLIDNALERVCSAELAYFLKDSSLDKILKAKNANEKVDEIIVAYSDEMESKLESLFSNALPMYIPASLIYLVNSLYSQKGHNPMNALYKERLLFVPYKIFADNVSPSLEDDYTNILHLIALGFMNDSYSYAEASDENVTDKSRVIVGFSSELAFRIGMSYLYGRDLKLNRAMAKSWFAYGMTVGNPYCALAYLLYFMPVNMEIQEISDQTLTDIYFILLNNLNLVRFHKNVRENTLLNFKIRVDERKCDFEENCLFNLLSFISALKFDCEYEELPFSIPIDIFDDFPEIIMENLTYNPQSSRLKSALALYIEITDLNNEDPEVVDDFADAANVKLKNNASDESVLFEFVEQGLKEKDPFSLEAYVYLYCIYRSTFESMPKKYLEQLSNNGFAKATFVLGNKNLDEHSDEKSLKYWQLASDQGSNFSMLNQALGAMIRNKNDEAIEYAFDALNYGNVIGYFLLFKAYSNTNPELAHTYLRYAQEYTIPDAVAVFRHLKETGEYKPLPFMSAIEELEALAEYSGEAALVMCEIYNAGNLLPSNMEKYLLYQKKAIENGYTSFFDHYRGMYKTTFPPAEENKAGYFVTYRQSLDMCSGFFNNENASSVEETAAISQKLNEIINHLTNGKTKLEKDILYNVRNSEMMSSFPLVKLKKVPKLDKRPDYKVLADIKNMLMDGSYLLTDDSSYRRLSVLCDELSEVSVRRSADLDLVRSFMAVRSVSCEPDYAVFKKYLTKGRFFLSNTCGVLSSIDFSFVTIKNSVDSEERESLVEEELDSDVFVTSIIQ